ncbi:MAG: hypothetical protein J6033_06125 [Lachnospiraceae bacterium]|nr:hypothetical protein [Lachnospiraceae bacterium]
MKRKILGLFLTFTMCTAMFAGCGNSVKDSGEAASATDMNGEESVSDMTNNLSDLEAVVHEIPAGESKSGNPLKGLIPFQGSTTDFPHSMDWFYIPVSAVQVANNIFDWNALEEKLNESAEQGHQAVLRFYYDYPGETIGVPQFLIDGGLEMKPYDEPDDLGGGGLCPDYSDENLRASMKNFIKAFGHKYDGDPRIGFITEGLLGFWGEWHNLPYDEDTYDGKPDWSIPT